LEERREGGEAEGGLSAEEERESDERNSSGHIDSGLKERIVIAL